MISTNQADQIDRVKIVQDQGKFEKLVAVPPTREGGFFGGFPEVVAAFEPGYSRAALSKAAKGGICGIQNEHRMGRRGL